MKYTIKMIRTNRDPRQFADVQAELTTLAFERLGPVSAVVALFVVGGEGVAATLYNDKLLWGVALVLVLAWLGGVRLAWTVRLQKRGDLTPAVLWRREVQLGVVMTMAATALAAAELHFFMLHDVAGEDLSCLVVFMATSFLRGLGGTVPWMCQVSSGIMISTMAVGFLFSGLADSWLCAICVLYGGYVQIEREAMKFDQTVGQVRAGQRDRKGADEDPLTGLASRRQFELTLGLTSRLRRGFTVLLINLDDFKAVNGQFGAAVGDRLLKLVAARLQTVSRGSDLIARLGADEFAILAQEPANEAAAKALAERIAGALATPFGIDSRAIKITASIGIWVGADGENDPAEVMRHADTALHKAKNEGGSSFQFA